MKPKETRTSNSYDETIENLQIKLWEANWDQARHVELLRAGYTTAFATVFIAVIAAMIFIKDEGLNRFVMLLLLCVFFMLSFLLWHYAFSLVLRWNTVFEKHRKAAEKIYEQMPTDLQNCLSVFHERKDIKPINYISTANLFKRFYFLLLFLLVVSFIYYVCKYLLTPA